MKRTPQRSKRTKTLGPDRTICRAARMSDLVIGRQNTDDAVFAPRTVTLMLVIGVIGFVGALVLGAYALDLRQADNGGEHALARSAVGFAGIVRLAAATGRKDR